jgi:predicted ATPase
MMRESAEALEAVAAEAVVVLVMEDLQWSDAATLEVLGYLAQRRSNARLQLIGTYRPTEVVVRGHRLRRLVQELYGRRQCKELTLELLSEAEIKEYLARRFGPSPALGTVSEKIYRYTDGNALFVVNFVDYLLELGLLSISEGQVELRIEGRALQKLVPETLQQLITRQIEGLREDEQQLLGVASVAGRTFTAAEVAGLVGQRLEEVEGVYDRLASAGRLIEAIGVTERPEGAVTVRYRFGHALYQEVLYEQLGQARRIRLHRQLGERKEIDYGDRVAEIAAELAVHFAEGRDYRRAVQYYYQAGESALRRSAYREVIDHCQEGLKLLVRLPATPEHQRQELALRMTLYPALTATRGFGAEGLDVVNEIGERGEQRGTRRIPLRS